MNHDDTVIEKVDGKVHGLSYVKIGISEVKNGKYEPF